jgi:inosose dehydratase
MTAERSIPEHQPRPARATDGRPLIGNAPVSYGVYGAGAGGTAASAERLLAAMAAAGYAGSELGPPGFFGSPEQTAAAFAQAGLHAVGAYVPIHFAAPGDVVARDLRGLERTCRELVACGGTGLVILADEGDERLLTQPARDPANRSLGLDQPGWQRLARLVSQAIELAGQHGLRTSFHPHISTYVESRWEVEKLLELTDVNLTLDTGHLFLAGADPVDCVRSWPGRINHVHLKDVRNDVLRRAKADHRTDFDEWWADVCVPLGQGDVDLDSMLAALSAAGYDGWLVVEQDRAPTPAADYPAVADQQADNRRWVTEHLAAAVAF